MTACPGCSLELPEDDWRAQIAHMEAEHPEIVAERLRRAGFVFDEVSGEWIDTLTDT